MLLKKYQYRINVIKFLLVRHDRLLISEAQEMGVIGITLSTDDFFTQSGNYNFNRNDIGEAHEWNKKRGKWIIFFSVYFISKGSLFCVWVNFFSGSDVKI